MTEEQKSIVVAERSRLAADFGNDFETVQRYCIEKFLARNSSGQKRENILDEEILLQISIALCSIDATFLNDRERLQNSAVQIRSQV